jgi:hypothetical protein
VKDAGKDGYRFSSLILGIVKSAPFQMRRVELKEDRAPGKRASSKQVEKG